MSSRAIGSSYSYTLNRTVDGAKIDLTGYTLQMKVVDPAGADTSINRAITQLTPDNLDFVVNITPAETATLSKGLHKVCHLLSDTATNYSNEVSFNLTFADSCF